MFAFDARQSYGAVRGHARGSNAAALHAAAQASLDVGDVLAAVRTPPGIDESTWLCVCLVDFHNAVSLCFGLVADVCTAAACPSMCATSRYEYLSSVGGGAPQRLPARAYVAALLTSVLAAVDAAGAAPPADFIDTTARPLFRRLVRVFSHLYCHHAETLAALGATGHVDACFRHLHAFIIHHGLVEAKELAPLAATLERLAAAPTGGAAK